MNTKCRNYYHLPLIVICYIDFVEEIKVNFKQAHTRALADFKKHQDESDDTCSWDI